MEHNRTPSVRNSRSRKCRTDYEKYAIRIRETTNRMMRPPSPQPPPLQLRPPPMTPPPVCLFGVFARVYELVLCFRCSVRLRSRFRNRICQQHPHPLFIRMRISTRFSFAYQAPLISCSRSRPRLRYFSPRAPPPLVSAPAPAAALAPYSLHAHLRARSRNSSAAIYNIISRNDRTTTLR